MTWGGDVGDRFGRFGGTAAWVLMALRAGPLGVPRLLDRVRELDGFVRPGTFFGAVARLERFEAIESTIDSSGRPAYRLRGDGSRADAAVEGAGS